MLVRQVFYHCDQLSAWPRSTPLDLFYLLTCYLLTLLFLWSGARRTDARVRPRSVVAGSGGDRVGSTRLLLLLWFRLKGEQLLVELMVEQEDLAVHQMVAHSPR